MVLISKNTLREALITEIGTKSMGEEFAYIDEMSINTLAEVTIDRVARDGHKC